MHDKAMTTGSVTPAPLMLCRSPGHLLLAALALGIAADYLVWHSMEGPGFALWVMLATVAALWLARPLGTQRQRLLLRWAVPAVLAAWLLVWRDLLVLRPAVVLVLVGCATGTLLEASGTNPRAARVADYEDAPGMSHVGILRAARVADYLRALLHLPWQIAGGPPRLFAHADLERLTHNPRLPGLIRGVLLALPVLFVFTALFAAADAGFSQQLARLGGLFPPTVPQHLLLVLVFGWLAGGMLTIACQPASVAVAPARKTLPLGAQESAVVLMLVTLLFIGFVFLQLGYLFGGSAVIEARSGLTVAQYARRGFIELIVVAALTLALLLALASTLCSRPLLRRLGTLLLVCVLIILASAVQRLWLYVQSFGLTLDRLVALAVLLWLGLNLLTFAATVLRERPAGFASGAAFSAITTVLLLGLVNPAAIVVNVNTTRGAVAVQDQTTASLDVAYLLQLGADAIPPLLARFDDLPRPAQCEVALTLLQQWYPAPTVNTINDWRDWNASRATAQRLVAEQHERLEDICRPASRATGVGAR